MNFLVNDIILFNNNIYIIFDVYNVDLKTNYMFIDLISYDNHDIKFTIYCNVDFVIKNFILVNHIFK